MKVSTDTEQRLINELSLNTAEIRRLQAMNKHLEEQLKIVREAQK